MGKVSFGVMIPEGHKFSLPSSASTSKQYEMILETARFAEKMGFDSGWLFDHFYPWPIITRDSCFESWTLLAALAAETKSLRLGHMVTCNSYRYPSILAKMAATVDVISNGRLEFGIGAGWYEEEYKAYGIPFPQPSIRIGMLEEAVQIIKKMWTEERASFVGTYYSVDEALNEPKPLQKPHPPITIGGGGEQRTLRVAAKYADRSNVGGFPDFEGYRRKFVLLEKYCIEAGRSPKAVEKSFFRDVFIGEDEVEVKRKAEIFKPKYDTLTEFFHRQIFATPEECIAEIKKYQELGITHFIIYFPDAVELTPMEIFAKKVMPFIKS